MKTLRDWNKYLDDLKRLRDLFYGGTTDESKGLHLDITKEDCNIIWNLLSSKANQVISTPLEFHEPVLPTKQRFIVNGINNDRIELVSNLDVRKLNRLLDAKSAEWQARLNTAKEAMQSKSFNADVPVLDGIEHEMVVSIDDAIEIVNKALNKEPIV